MAPGDVKHDYHLVEPSPWPVVGSLGAFVMLVGAVLWLNKAYAGFGVLAGIPWIFGIGLALVLYTAAGWWRDVVLESVLRREHTPIVKLGFRYGMVLFILAEVAFFAAWFWAYFNTALFPHQAGLGAWPPPGLVTSDPWQWPLLNTVILLTSATTVTWALHAIKAGDRQGTILALALSVVLGTAFVLIQAHEYLHTPFTFGLNGAALGPLSDPAHARLSAGQGNLAAIYGSSVLMVIGLHSLHVVAGTVFLAVCLGRAIAGHFTPTRHFGFEAAAWYWHFVDAVWLFLFVTIYLSGRG